MAFRRCIAEERKHELIEQARKYRAKVLDALPYKIVPIGRLDPYRLHFAVDGRTVEVLLRPSYNNGGVATVEVDFYSSAYRRSAWRDTGWSDETAKRHAADLATKLRHMAARQEQREKENTAYETSLAEATALNEALGLKPFGWLYATASDEAAGQVQVGVKADFHLRATPAKAQQILVELREVLDRHGYQGHRK